MHDDVVDAAETRRGFLSISALWKSKVAVLVGDYLLSRGLLISMENDGVDLLRITSKAVEAMSEGELLQIEKARRLDITEEVYYEIMISPQNRFVDCSLLRRRGRQCRRRPRPCRIDAVFWRGDGHRFPNQG